MATADIKVRIATQLVIRESDAHTLLLVEFWCGRRLLNLHVLERTED